MLKSGRQMHFESDFEYYYQFSPQIEEKKLENVRIWDQLNAQKF